MDNNNLGKFNIILSLLTFWTFVWMYYNSKIRTKYENHLIMDPISTFKIAELPSFMKCWIKEVSTNPINNDCTKESLDGWSIGHIVIYLSIGLLVPNHYKTITFFSVACEIWEYYMGWRARWFLCPATNIFGYVIGSVFNKIIKLPYERMYKSMSSPIITSFSTGILTVLLSEKAK